MRATKVLATSLACRSVLALCFFLCSEELRHGSFEVPAVRDKVLLGLQARVSYD